jgi:hypothetical protein
MFSSYKKEFNPRQEVIEYTKNRWWVILAFFLAGLIIFVFTEMQFLKLITPKPVLEKREQLEKALKDLYKIQNIPINDKALIRQRIEQDLSKIDRAYPKIVGFWNLFDNAYPKPLLFIAYGGSIALSLSPLLILFFIYKRKIEPVVFPKPEIQFPLELGEFKELLNFSLAKVDRETFKSLFHSDKDYETFWRMVNANIVKDDRAGFIAIADYVKQTLKKAGVKREEKSEWNWKVNLQTFWRGWLDKYKQIVKFDREVKDKKSFGKILKSGKPLKEEWIEEVLFIAEDWSKFSKVHFPPRFGDAKRGKIEFTPLLLAKVGKFDTNLISKDIGRILDELERWAELNGIDIGDKKLFRARMTLSLYSWLIRMFVKDKTIPAGLVNRFVNDYVAKYLISYLPTGLILKATNPYTAEARKYLLVYRTYEPSEAFAELHPEDYLELKYNLVFDVEQEEKAKTIKKKVKIYENYSLWNV